MSQKRKSLISGTTEDCEKQRKKGENEDIQDPTKHT
jgi:hypothetical protein